MFFNVFLFSLKGYSETTGKGTNLSTSNLCTLLFKLLELLGTFLIYTRF